MPQRVTSSQRDASVLVQVLGLAGWQAIGDVAIRANQIQAIGSAAGARSSAPARSEEQQAIPRHNPLPTGCGLICTRKTSMRPLVAIADAAPQLDDALVRPRPSRRRPEQQQCVVCRWISWNSRFFTVFADFLHGVIVLLAPPRAGAATEVHPAAQAGMASSPKPTAGHAVGVI